MKLLKLQVLLYCLLGEATAVTTASTASDIATESTTETDLEQLYRHRRRRNVQQQERSPSTDLHNDDLLDDDALLARLEGVTLSFSMTTTDTAAPSPGFAQEGATPAPTLGNVGVGATAAPTLGNVAVGTPAPTFGTVMATPAPTLGNVLTSPAPTPGVVGSVPQPTLVTSPPTMATVMTPPPTIGAAVTSPAPTPGIVGTIPPPIDTFAPTIGTGLTSPAPTPGLIGGGAPAPTTTNPVTTPSPTMATVLTPAPTMTSVMTPAPTPSVFGVQLPTPFPVDSGNETPTPAGSNCLGAFAYCRSGVMSQCFGLNGSDNTDSMTSDGWSMDVTGLDLNAAPLTCDLISGATNCNPDSGIVVGSVLLTDVSVTYSLFSGATASSFHTYIGNCPYSDGGVGMQSGQPPCLTSNPVPYQVELYPLSTGTTFETSPLSGDFSFDVTNQLQYTQGAVWGPTYQTLTVSSHGQPVYVSAQAQVCTTSAVASPPPVTTTSASPTPGMIGTNPVPTPGVTGSNPVATPVATPVPTPGVVGSTPVATPVPTLGEVISTPVAMPVPTPGVIGSNPAATPVPTLGEVISTPVPTESTVVTTSPPVPVAGEPTPVATPPTSLTMPPYEWTFNPASSPPFPDFATDAPAPTLDQPIPPAGVDTVQPAPSVDTIVPTPAFVDQGTPGTNMPSFDFVAPSPGATTPAAPTPLIPQPPTTVISTPAPTLALIPASPTTLPGATGPTPANPTMTTGMPTIDFLAPSPFGPTTTVPPGTVTAVPTLDLVAPSGSGTMMPTLGQSFPTLSTPSPTLPNTLGCVDAFAYCGETISVCFDSVASIAPPPGAMVSGNGWSINLTDYNFETSGPLTCQLLSGADQCNVATATVVGSVDITDLSVSFTTKTPSTSTSFHVYAGNCLMSDSGYGEQTGGECSDNYNPYDVSLYPLFSGDLSTPTNNFVFDVTNQGQYTQAALWGPTYETLALSGHGSPVYLSAHAQVCFGNSGSGDFPTAAPGSLTLAPVATTESMNPTPAMGSPTVMGPPVTVTTFKPTGPTTNTSTPPSVQQVTPVPSNSIPGTLLPTFATVPPIPSTVDTILPTPTLQSLPPIPSGTTTTSNPSTGAQTLPPIASSPSTPTTLTLPPISSGTVATNNPTVGQQTLPPVSPSTNVPSPSQAAPTASTLPPIPVGTITTNVPTVGSQTLPPVSSSTDVPSPSQAAPTASNLPPIPAGTTTTNVPTVGSQSLPPIPMSTPTPTLTQVTPTTATLPPIPSGTDNTLAPTVSQATPTIVTLPPISTSTPAPTVSLAVPTALSPTSSGLDTYTPTVGSQTLPPITTPSSAPVSMSSPTNGIPTVSVPVPTAVTSMPSIMQTSPTVMVPDVCVDTFVYCGEELSVCFDSVDSVQPPMDASSSGWSINLSGVSFTDGPLVCQLIAGAQNCDINASGAFVAGTAEITESSITYFVKSGWSSTSFQTYVGSCLMSDGGVGESTTGQCSTAYSPYDVENYPLDSGVLPTPVTNYGFDIGNQTQFTTSPWGSYQTFDVTSHGTQVYLSGHAQICMCSDMPATPSSSNVPLAPSASGAPIGVPPSVTTVPGEGSPTSSPLASPSPPSGAITAPSPTFSGEQSLPPLSAPTGSTPVSPSASVPTLPTSTSTTARPSLIQGVTPKPLGLVTSAPTAADATPTSTLQPAALPTLPPSFAGPSASPVANGKPSPSTATAIPTLIQGPPDTPSPPSAPSVAITRAPLATSIAPVASPTVPTTSPSGTTGMPDIGSPTAASQPTPTSLSSPSVPTANDSTLAPTPAFDEEGSTSPAISVPQSPTIMFPTIPSPSSPTLPSVPTSPTTNAATNMPSNIQKLPTMASSTPNVMASPTVTNPTQTLPSATTASPSASPDKPSTGTQVPTSFVGSTNGPSSSPTRLSRATPVPVTKAQTAMPSSSNMKMGTRAPSVGLTSHPTSAINAPAGSETLTPASTTAEPSFVFDSPSGVTVSPTLLDATPTKRPVGAPTAGVKSVIPTLVMEPSPSGFVTPTKSSRPINLPSGSITDSPFTSQPVLSPTTAASPTTAPVSGEESKVPTGSQPVDSPTTATSPSSNIPSASKPVTVPTTGNYGELGNCVDAFVYCGATASKCFNEFDGVEASSDASGWSIDLSAIDYESETLECQILANVPNCDVDADSTLLLGYAEISDSSFTWYLRSEYASTTFQLYVGTCPMSDGGAAYQRGSAECSSPTPYDVSTYPLVANELRYPKTKYSFDTKNQERKTSSNWTTQDGTKYQIFELSNFGEPLYLSAHAEICECVDGGQVPGLPSPAGSPSISSSTQPPFVESGESDANPTSDPTSAPSKTPTGSPTKIPTAQPTNAPTDAPTTSPTLSPTVAPTAAPTASPTPNPTTTSISRGTSSPTRTVDVIPTSNSGATLEPTSNAACEDAYVYCPGRSTCFSDPSFNCYTQTKGRGVWGWNIEYTAEDGLVDDCVVIVGASGCDEDSGTVIGNATISPDQFSIILNSDAATGSSIEYTFYAGECRGSDGGQVLDLGICLADTVATLANDPHMFPLTSGVVSLTSYVFDESVSPRNAWQSYSTFPLGSDSREYLTAHVEICQ
ncbi:hypothetical protein MPSEU_000589200 [Mayamaea pseudoterrestris]|nr:hypothetical protein MPSEU_000589200 [Mayamaea pseudoterrestris]